MKLRAVLDEVNRRKVAFIDWNPKNVLCIHGQSRGVSTSRIPDIVLVDFAFSEFQRDYSSIQSQSQEPPWEVSRDWTGVCGMLLAGEIVVLDNVALNHARNQVLGKSR
jgi:hypothetical protein